MRCNKCGNDNQENNRFCGECGSPLLRQAEPSAANAAPSGPVLNSFRDDVERQRSELREIRQKQAGTEPPTPIGTQPLSKLATALSGFGPADSATAVREPAKPWFSPAREAVRAEAPITGPSFLGLSDPDPLENPDLTYLYEEDAPPSHTRQWIAALIAIAFVGVIVYEWRQNPDWQTMIVGRAQQTWQQRKASAAAQSPLQVPSSINPGAQASPASVPTSGAVAGSTQGLPQRQGSASNRPDISGPENAVGQTGGDGAIGAEADVTAGGKKQSDNAAKTQTSPKSFASKNSERNVAPVEVSSGARSREPENALVVKAEGYLYGRGGMPRNCDQALVYLRTAADRGNATARSKLGGLYATGNCVPLDRARAYNWFTRAREAGDRNVWIERNMSMLWSEMTPEERARTR